MKFTKIIAVLLIITMSFGILSACNDTSYIMKVGDVKYPTGPYAYFAYMIRDSFDYQAQMYGKKLSDVIDTEENGKKVWEMIIEQTQNQYINYILINNKFKELGFTLTDEQKQSVESAYANYKSQFGNENLNKILKTLGISDEEFKEFLSYNVKNGMIIDRYFGEGGEKEIPESELRSKYLENYARFKSAIFVKIDSEGNALSFDEIAKKKAFADEALAKIQSGEMTFEEMIQKYSEEYVTLTDEMTEEEKTAAQAQNTESVENGVVINKEGIYNQNLYDYYGVSVDSTIVDKVFSMNVGDVALIEVSSSFWIVKKYDSNEKEDYFQNKKNVIFDELAQPGVDELNTKWKNELPYVFNKNAVNKFDPRGLKSLFLDLAAANKTTPETDSNPAATN